MRYEQVLYIRTFEEIILELFHQNKLSGTTHTYIGEEATAVAIMQFVNNNDFVFSNHRCHGHYLAYGGSAKNLLAEIMSKTLGLCEGRGGSQHIHYRNFFTNGIQGGIVPNAVGVALANKLSDTLNNTIVFLGDGTLGQGVVYESLNIASIYKIPIMFVIEDNQYAMSTRRTDVIAGNIANRIKGFDIKTVEIESTDVDTLSDFFKEAFSYLNETRQPICVIVHNYRLAAHSKGDDTRDVAEITANKINDPVSIIEKKIGKSSVNSIRKDFRNEILKLATDLNSEKSLVIKEIFPETDDKKISFLPSLSEHYVKALQRIFYDAMEHNKEIIFLGEDIRDPYGGAFKATKGLSLAFNERVMNMPISEACMVGMSVGLALNHKIPVVEMMFGDFVTLAFDQLLNHAAKYGWIYGEDIRVPMILRVPMGGKRGYGPTHSQSLEKFLIGIPLIKVLALSFLHDPYKVYEKLFNSIKEPTVVVENKKLYGEKIPPNIKEGYRDFKIKEVNHYGYSTMHLSIDHETKPDVYLITYGGMVKDSLEVSETLMIEEEIQVDVIILCQLSPLPILDLKEIINHSTPIIFVEEGTKTAGVGAEYIARLAEEGIGTRYYRFAAWDLPIPNGLVLEEQVLPHKKTIIDKIKDII